MLSTIGVEGDAEEHCDNVEIDAKIGAETLKRISLPKAL
jgi:hypothetical protein